MKKAIIYLRTSTKEQNPELQKKECIEFCKRMNLEIVRIAIEKGSAYKLEKIRPIWEQVQEQAKKEKLHIVLWRYDRAFRNRAEFFKFMKIIFEVYHTKVYSVTEPSILSFWEMLDKSYSDNPIFNELFKAILQAFWNFMIQQAGEQSEEESRKKSERVKLAVVKEDGKPTLSYKGKKWGFHSVGKDTDKQIINLFNEGKTYRQIRDSVFYWNKSRHKKNISLGYISKLVNVHKLNIIKQRKEIRQSSIQHLTN